MTFEEVKNLSDKELRERVANLACCFENDLCCRCGKSAKMVKYSAFFCSEECAERASDFTLDDGNQIIERYFNYPNDLNAMHGAEKVLSKVETGWSRYNVNLTNITAAKNPKYHATARQRAEAFVLTMENK